MLDEYDSTQPIGLTSHRCWSCRRDSFTRVPFYANPLGFWDPKLIHKELFVSDRSLTHIMEEPLNRPRSLALGAMPTANQDTLLEAVCQVQDQYNEGNAAIQGLTDQVMKL